MKEGKLWVERKEGYERNVEGRTEFYGKKEGRKEGKGMEARKESYERKEGRLWKEGRKEGRKEGCERKVMKGRL